MRRNHTASQTMASWLSAGPVSCSTVTPKPLPPRITVTLVRPKICMSGRSRIPSHVVLSSYCCDLNSCTGSRKGQDFGPAPISSRRRVSTKHEHTESLKGKKGGELQNNYVSSSSFLVKLSPRSGSNSLLIEPFSPSPPCIQAPRARAICLNFLVRFTRL